MHFAIHCQLGTGTRWLASHSSALGVKSLSSRSLSSLNSGTKGVKIIVKWWRQTSVLNSLQILSIGPINMVTEAARLVKKSDLSQLKTGKTEWTTQFRGPLEREELSVGRWFPEAELKDTSSAAEMCHGGSPIRECSKGNEDDKNIGYELEWLPKFRICFGDLEFWLKSESLVQSQNSPLSVLSWAK